MISFAVSLIVALTPATTEPRYFRYFGYGGNDSCADWVQNRPPHRDRTQALEGWVLGFLSARSGEWERIDQAQPLATTTAMLGWIDLYCSAHPLDTVLQATTKLIAELKHRASGA